MSIKNILKDSIKNIKKHKHIIIIIFLLILLICWIIYLVYYKINETFETSTTQFIPTPTLTSIPTIRADTVDDLFPNFNGIIPELDYCYELENEY